MPPQNPYPKHQKGHWAEYRYNGNIKIIREADEILIEISIASGVNDIIYDDLEITY